jgi:coenzyme F420 hydrogenase subunit beta
MLRLRCVLGNMSGGAATALALFCLQKRGASGVLHIGASPEAPLTNLPVLSRNKAALLTCTGSRYSPAAPSERLDWIADVPGPVVFIAKPCDVVALREYENTHPELHGKIGLAISIFCAGNADVGGDSQDSA